MTSLPPHFARLRPNSKRLRGLKGWDETAFIAPVRTIVKDGQVLDPKRFQQIPSPQSRLSALAQSRGNSGREGTPASSTQTPQITISFPGTRTVCGRHSATSQRVVLPINAAVENAAATVGKSGRRAPGTR